MEVFQLNRPILEFFGMCLNPEQTSKKSHLLSRIANFIMLWISICTVIISLEYIVSHFDDTENNLFAVMQVAANVASGGGYWAFYQNKYKVSDYIERISKLVNERCHIGKNSIKDLYERAERKSIFVSKWPLIMFCAYYDILIIIATTYTIIFKLIPANSDPATWYAMYKMSAPFDVHSVHGYFCYLFMVIVTLHTYAILITSQASYFLSSCFYLEAFCEDLDRTVYQLNDLYLRNRIDSKRRLRNQLPKIIRFNIQITDLFQQLKDIVTGIVFFQLLCGAVYCSTGIYQLDSASKHIGVNFFVLIVVSTLSIATTLPYCYYSAQISLCLQMIGDHAYTGAIWYQFPADVQKYILLIIQNFQTPRFFTAYGIINCSLETFKEILNAAASYYIMLKSIMNR